MNACFERSLRCLVVDDDSSLRRTLVDHIGADPDVTEVFEAANGYLAIELVRKRAPDIMFLGVQMSGLGGMQVVEQIGISRMPPTVFMTGLDHMAIVSFESLRLDYLLKPLSTERLELAFGRVKEKMDDMHIADFRQKLGQSMSAMIPAPRYLDRFVIKSQERTELVRVESVDCIESAGVYLSLHVGSRRLIYRASIQDVAASLDPQRFIRIHRSTIVNIDRIVCLEPLSHGEFNVIMTSGEQFRVSRTYRPLLEARLGQSL